MAHFVRKKTEIFAKKADCKRPSSVLTINMALAYECYKLKSYVQEETITETGGDLAETLVDSDPEG